MNPWARALACASLLLLAPHPERAIACGGADIVDVGELMAPQRALVADLLEDPYEGFDLDDFRFLRPFELAGRDPHGWLAVAMTDPDPAATTGTPLPHVDLTVWQNAVRAGKLTEAQQAAQSVVDGVLDLPAPLAAANASELQRAVEYLELAPKLAELDNATLVRFFVDRQPSSEASAKWLADAQQVRATPREGLPALLQKNPQHPRAASLEFVALTERVHADLPSGWPGEIAAAPPVWDALEHGFDAWLTAHPKHPLRDLVSLSKLRVIFLRGDGKRAWDLLLGMYPRHALRVAWEMRHLLLANMRPQHVDVSKLQDPVLATALVRESTELTAPQWTALWKRSEQQANAPWAINLQERLFVQALRLANLGKAPADLPGALQKRPPRWAELHTAALLAAHRDDEALQQALALQIGKDDQVAAKLRANAYLRHCDWVHVAETAQQIGPDSLRYTLEVLVDDNALRTLLARSDALAPRAAHALALRVLGEDQWQAAADVWQAKDSPEARSWRDAAKLAADESAAGRLTFAKWLLGRDGAHAFPDAERAYSRGLKQRLDVLDDKAKPAQAAVCGLPERDRLADVLLRAGRRERALSLYAEALRDLPVDDKRAASTLRSADLLYNQLLNWDAGSSQSYPKLLAASPAATLLREAGKRIHVGGK